MPKGKSVAKGRGPVKKHWGLLAYIAGDNNLSDAGLEDLIELCAVGASERVYVGVEIDTYGEYTGSLRYEITEPDWEGRAHRTVIERLPEKDTGDPETLRSFLSWGFKRFPADNHLVVVWNHGAGFRSVRRDIGYDDFGSSLDMPEIEDAFRRAGIGPKNKIAILGFDACLMNMLEIAYHFKDQVDLIVGSQQSEPGDGWPYDEVLRLATKGPHRNDLAKRIVKAYIKSYEARGIFNVTQSAIDCTKTEPAMEALSDLGHLLVERIDGYRRELTLTRLHAQTFEMADYVDLIHLMTLMARNVPDGGIADAAKSVSRAAASCVLVSETLGGTVAKSHGLSVWFPAHKRLYSDYRAKYLSLRFAEAYPGWISFLDAYHV
jgi:hypothetical protein